MISLINLPSSDDGLLARCNPRCDSGGAIVWDIDLAFTIESKEDAILVEEFVPGTVPAWTCANDEGGKSRVSTTGNFDIVRATFSLNNEKLAEAHAEIKQCTVATTAGAAALTVKMRVHGLLCEAAGRLAYALNDAVTIALESRQVSLFVNQNETKEADVALANADNLVGSIIDTEHGTGLVVSAKEGMIELDCLTETRSIKAPAKISAMLKITPSTETDLETILMAYRSMAVKAQIEPSWEDIIEAIGLLYGEGRIAPVKSDSEDFCWVLNSLIVGKAIEIALHGDGPVVEGEA